MIRELKTTETQADRADIHNIIELKYEAVRRETHSEEKYNQATVAKESSLYLSTPKLKRSRVSAVGKLSTTASSRVKALAIINKGPKKYVPSRFASSMVGSQDEYSSSEDSENTNINVLRDELSRFFNNQDLARLE